MQEISQPEPAVNRAEHDHIRWGWVALTVVGLEIALIISAIAWVAIYSYLINPGHDAVYYQNHAQFASPIVSVVVGMPYLFFACRWVGRKAGTRAVAMCLSIWLILFLIDVLLILLGGLTAYIGAMVVISHATKMLAAYFGGRAALKNVLNTRQAGE
jgi:hypothetical protein